MTNNTHLPLFSAISFAVILLIIVFTPKASIDINSTSLSAYNSSYSSQVSEY